MPCCIWQWLNTLRPRQNGRHFADDIFKRIFVNENARILIEISLKFVPKGPIKILQHNGSRWWLVAWTTPSHYLNQWWFVYRRIYASFDLNELTSNSGAISQLNDSYRYNIPFVWLCDPGVIYVVDMLCIAVFSVFAWLCALLWYKNEKPLVHLINCKMHIYEIKIQYCPKWWESCSACNHPLHDTLSIVLQNGYVAFLCTLFRYFSLTPRHCFIIFWHEYCFTLIQITLNCVPKKQ